MLCQTAPLLLWAALAVSHQWKKQGFSAWGLAAGLQQEKAAVPGSSALPAPPVMEWLLSTQHKQTIAASLAHAASSVVSVGEHKDLSGDHLTTSLLLPTKCKPLVKQPGCPYGFLSHRQSACEVSFRANSRHTS